MAREGFSPPQLFLSYGLVAAGALLVAERPGSHALLILDWRRLFLLAGVAAAVLFVAERWLSRGVRRESRDYPYRFAILVGLFGLSVTLVGAVNGSFARTPPRVVRVAVRGWESTKHATGPPVPLREEGGLDPVVAVAESWIEPGATIRIAVSPEAQEQAEGPGPHALELELAPGFLGVEYVQAVRLVTP
ncbi:MAG TPA: hypothetical protein VEB43_18295 [Anaeromyxobacter sp.]|nr:hypothetical protein [Anaeromyxobacter sp.]